MEIKCTAKELQIFKKIAHAAEEQDVETYLVGGFVRDKILGRETKDADIVCVGDGIEMAKAVANKFHPVPQVNFFKNFGTAHIKINLSDNDETAEDLEGDVFDIEFVGARKESYRADSRKPEVETGTIEDDQNRRDFTINALAISLNKKDFGKLVDPFNGLKDLDDKVIKTPLDPLKTFSDDPLRMMRAVRFAAQLNFIIEKRTWLAIKEDAQRIKIVSQERITDELNKIVISPKPSIGFDLLYQSGLLQIIFPKWWTWQAPNIKMALGIKIIFIIRCRCWIILPAKLMTCG